jgi:hypothetical protein
VPFLETAAETALEAVVIDTTVAPDGFVRGRARPSAPVGAVRDPRRHGAEFRVDKETIPARPGDVVTVESGTPIASGTLANAARSATKTRHRKIAGRYIGGPELS